MTDTLREAIERVTAWLDDDEEFRIPDTEWGRGLYDALRTLLATHLAPDAETERWPRVVGKCPECGSESLFRGDGGYITCSRIDCRRPDAASDVLAPPSVPAGSDTADEPVVGCGARIPSPDPRISFVCSLPVLHDGPHSNEMPGTTAVPSLAPADEREDFADRWTSCHRPGQHTRYCDATIMSRALAGWKSPTEAEALVASTREQVAQETRERTAFEIADTLDAECDGCTDACPFARCASIARAAAEGGGQ